MGGQKPDVGLENMKGVLRGKNTCGLSKGVCEVGAHKGDSLIGGRGWWWWCQHEESILKVGGLAWLIKSSVCVCLMWRINSHGMKRAPRHVSSSTWAVRA